VQPPPFSETADARDATVVVCTQQQRLEQIARMCERYEGTHATRASTFATLDNMTDKEVINMGERLEHENRMRG
jgi:hypothetical protein